MRWVYVIIGAFFILSGALWTLQGLDVVGGSSMSGVTIWAIIGPVVAVAGIVMLISGIRRFRA